MHKLLLKLIKYGALLLISVLTTRLYILQSPSEHLIRQSIISRSGQDSTTKSTTTTSTTTTTTTTTTPYRRPEDWLNSRNAKDGLPIGSSLGELRPNLKLVIGVPTVGREKDIYLYDTLDSVFKGIEIYKNKSESSFRLPPSTTLSHTLYYSTRTNRLTGFTGVLYR